MVPSAVARVIRKNQLRVGLARGFDALVGALVWAVSLLFVLVAFVSLGLLPTWVGATAPVLTLAWVLGYSLYCAWVAARPVEVAQSLDQSFSTHDRLGASLDFAARSARTPLMDAQLAEAERYAAEHLQKAKLPLPTPKNLRRVVFLALAALVSLPAHLLSITGADYAPTPRAIEIAKQAEQIHQELGQLEALAEKKSLPSLAAHLKDARAELRKNQRNLEEKLERPLWDLSPEERKEVMPHEDKEPPPEELPASQPDAEASIPPPAPIGGAMAALSAAQGLLDQTPIGKFDADPMESYADAFAEIDKMFKISPNATAKELNDLAAKVDKTAKVFNNMGADAASESPSGGGGAITPKENMNARMNRQAPEKKTPGIQDDLGGLLQKSFGEFLKKYTEHIKEEAVKRATHEAQKDAQATISMKLPPDKKANLNERKPTDPSGNPDKLEQMDPNAAKDLLEKLMASKGKEQITEKENGAQVGGDHAQAGGKGSGKGKGDEKAQENVNASGDKNVDLNGQIGDGKSAIQVIKDYSKFGASAEASAPQMHELYQGAVKEAVQGLSQPGIPDEMREYVKMYFLALDPKNTPPKK